MFLTKNDVQFVVSRLPKDIREMMMKYPLFLGGGFIRATIAGEVPSDIDLFGPSVKELETWANELCDSRGNGIRKIKTANAITLYNAPRMPVQFITRWVYDDAIKVAESFDFTIAQAVIWYCRSPLSNYNHVGPCWLSFCHDEYYSDLAARRLVYTRPQRNEDAGGSILRVRKFLGRGYNIQPTALAYVLARLFAGIKTTRLLNMGDETAVSGVLEGLLRDVDPLTVIDGLVMPDEDPMTEQDVVSALGMKLELPDGTDEECEAIFGKAVPLPSAVLSARALTAAETNAIFPEGGESRT